MAFGASPSLALGGSPHVNLMPRSEIDRRAMRVLVRRWAWALCAAVVIVALVTTGVLWAQAQAQARFTAENARTNDLLASVAALQPVSQKLQLQSELADFRERAMGTDLEWSGLISTLETSFPADVAITDYILAPGGLLQGDDPTAEVGAAGTVTFAGPTPVDIVALIRAVRELPGILAVDGWMNTLDSNRYAYELRLSFDQSVYTGAYAATEEGTE